MANVRHLLADVVGAGALFASAQISTAGVVSQQSPPLSQSSDITCVKNGTGDFTVTISPFKGPLGFAQVGIQPINSSLISATVKAAPSYSGDALSFEILLFNSSASATDSIFEFEAVAY